MQPTIAVISCTKEKVCWNIGIFAMSFSAIGDLGRNEGISHNEIETPINTAFTIEPMTIDIGSEELVPLAILSLRQ